MSLSFRVLFDYLLINAMMVSIDTLMLLINAQLMRLFFVFSLCDYYHLSFIRLFVGVWLS